MANEPDWTPETEQWLEEVDKQLTHANAIPYLRSLLRSEHAARVKAEIAIAKITDAGIEAAKRADKAEADLAECYRLSGADPDGNEDWWLASMAVEEVRRLREDYDLLELPSTPEKGTK